MQINKVSKINKEGLWQNNPALVQLLGLCPLLAVSNSVVNSLAMGICTLFVLLISELNISALRHHIPNSMRLPLFMLIIASAVTAIEIIMNAYFYQLYLSLGIFLPLIVTNCIIAARAEVFASKHKLIDSAMDAIMMGLGFMWVLLVLGAVREVLSQGTLLNGMEHLFGSGFNNGFANLSITVVKPQLFFLAGLPAGAFISLGLLIALKNAIDLRQTKAKQINHQHTKNEQTKTPTNI